MAAASVHLSDKVLPIAPVRQWVLSVPYELRWLLASKAAVLSAVIRIVMQVVLGWYRRRARDRGLEGAEAGAVSFVQRFGGSLNAHTHLHAILIDGVYTRDKPGGAPVFHFVPAPTHSEIAQLATTIGQRVCRMLRRRGLLGEANHESNEAESVDAALDACRKVALSRGRFERIDERGRSQQELFASEEPMVVGRKNSPWLGEHQGFSLHAGVSFGALDHKGREKLVRYCTRPPIALGRLSVLRDGSVAYRTKCKSRGGKTHRVMPPMELLARLASLVAPPHIPLTRYHGVLAPRSSWRAQIVPRSACRHGLCDHVKPSTIPAHVAPSEPDGITRPAAAVTMKTHAPSPASMAPCRPSTSYVPWALLLRRTFGFEVLECTSCHATMLAIAVITQREVVGRILSHLHLPLCPQPNVDGCSVRYEVTGESIPDWLVGVDPEPWERGPPSAWEGVDPPSPEE